MSSFSIAFEALATYISSAETSPNTVSVFPLNGLGRDNREKIFEYFHHPSSNESRTFQDATHINIFSSYNHEQQVECRQLSPLLLRQWISTTFETNRQGPAEERRRTSSRQRRTSSMLDGFTQERDRNRRRLNPRSAGNGQPHSDPPGPPRNGPSDSDPQNFTDYTSLNPTNPLYNVMNVFVESIYRSDYATCVHCNERRRGIINEICTDCAKSLSKAPNISLLSKDNDMDPYWHPNPMAIAELKNLERECPLSDVEQMLIARHIPIMKVYRLRGRDNENLAFSGNVVNISQNIDELVSLLPRTLEHLPVLVVQRSTSDPSVFRDFTVNTNNLLRWLVFLKTYNPAYCDITINFQWNSAERIFEAARSHLDVRRTVDESNIPEQIDEDSNEDLSDSQLPDLDPGEDEILETGGSGMIDSHHDEREEVSKIVWPRQGNEPLDEYNLPFLLTRSWPTLFPFARGDVTNLTHRRVKVSWNSAIKHYQSYARYNGTRWWFPFSSNHRFSFYVHDVDERHRVQSACSVYLNRNSVDKNMTIADLRAISNNSSSEDFAMQKRLQRYGRNILGSSSYMAEKKHELMSLISSKPEPSNNTTRSSSTNMPTIWWTLSLANFYWRDLHRVIGPPLPRQEGESIDEYSRRYRLQCKQDYVANPHIVDEVFCFRVKEFVKHFFGPQGLEASWYWFRYEWQKRGNVHCHGLCRLEKDPGLQSLSSSVMKGRKAAQILRIAKQILLSRNEDTSLFPEEDILTKHVHDEFIPSLESNITTKLSTTMLTAIEINELIDQITLGKLADKKLCDFRDSILTMEHPAPPPDAVSETRDEGVQPDFMCHPCFICHSLPNNTHGLRTDVYNDILNNCMRHRHHPSYCMRNNTCRFHFPHPLEQDNSIVMKEIPYRIHRDGLHGTLRKTIIEIRFRTNDSWLNSHNPIGLLAWGANMDMSILIDPSAVMEYVAKYCTKTEPCSSAFQPLLSAAIRKRQEQDQLETPKVLRTVFNLMSRRDKCSQEVAHLIASRPYVHCSHQFVKIQLDTSMREINVDAEDDSAPAVRDNICDLYLQRMDIAFWKDDAVLPAIAALQAMTLVQFCKRFTCSRDGSRPKITHRVNSKSIIPVFIPEYSCNPLSPHYWVYCLISLWKFIPHFDRLSLYDGDHHTDFSTCQCRIDECDVTSTEKTSIITAWQSFLRTLPDEDIMQMPDGINREVQRLRREGVDDSQPIGSLSIGFDVDGEDDELTTYFKGPEEYTQDIEWTENYDWRAPQHSYENNEFTTTYARSMMSTVENIQQDDSSTSSFQHLSSTLLHQCNVDQKNAVTLWHAISMNHDTLTEQGSNAMIVNGVAGTGKSHTIKSMVYASSTVPLNHGKHVLIMAPTGKAALAAKGFTLHSSRGLYLPVRTKNQRAGELKGPKLTEIQNRFEKICGIIIDEYSMISLLDLYWINKRLQQAMKNNNLFGGIPIAFMGDPGQLPPVGGLSVWANRSSNRLLSGNQLEASMAYMQIKNVIKLHTVQRQSDPGTLDFLLAIRDGTIQERHWRWFNDLCSEQAIRHRGDIIRFEGSNCVHIYSTNKEVFEYNHRCLQKLGKPINKLTAHHDSSQSKTRPSDTCEQLPPVVYLTIDSSVMLLRNVMTHYGLVNGSCGLVKDFIYGDDASLPQFIVIDFPSYSGPPIFSKQEQRTWVPLPTFVYHWGENNKHFRESFPITLSYAITIHKSQGMTINHPVWVSLGDKEMEHGQTYVALSRVTDLHNLCIGAGVSLQRLIT